MTADPLLATDLHDRTSARGALFELSRLLPVAKVTVQQLRERPDDSRDLDDLLAAKYPQHPPVDGADEGDTDAPAQPQRQPAP